MRILALLMIMMTISFPCGCGGQHKTTSGRDSQIDEPREIVMSLTKRPTETDGRSTLATISALTGMGYSAVLTEEDIREVETTPKPFAPSPSIEFAVVDSDSVCIQLFNSKGSCVAELFRGVMVTGSYVLMIHQSKSELDEGVYILKAVVGNVRKFNKIVILHNKFSAVIDQLTRRCC